MSLKKKNWLKLKMVKDKIGVFIDHDVTLRNFSDNNDIFKELENNYELIYFFPNYPKRINEKKIKNFKKGKKIIIDIKKKKLYFSRLLFHLAAIHHCKFRKGDDKKASLLYRKKVLNSRLNYYVFRILALTPIYHVFKYFFKKILIKYDKDLEKKILENEIKIIIHPTVLEGLFVYDLTEIGKKNNIKTIYIMNSWDNPSMAGLPYEPPDNYLVWGDQTKRHAIEIRRIPRENVIIAGANQFSNYSNKIDYKEIEKYKKNFNFKKKKLILYGGSSNGVNEVEHLEILENHLNNNNCDYQILYRPHPWKIHRKVEKNFFECKFTNIFFDPFSYQSYIDNKNSLESKIYASRPDDLKVILNIVDAVFTPFSTISLEAAINKKSIGIYYPEDVSELDPTFATVTKRIAITEFISDMKPLICTNKQELTKSFDILSKNSENLSMLESCYERSKKYCDLRIKPNKILANQIKNLI